MSYLVPHRWDSTFAVGVLGPVTTRARFTALTREMPIQGWAGFP
jgi:hypothetical protein